MLLASWFLLTLSTIDGLNLGRLSRDQPRFDLSMVKLTVPNLEYWGITSLSAYLHFITASGFNCVLLAEKATECVDGVNQAHFILFFHLNKSLKSVEFPLLQNKILSKVKSVIYQ